MSALLIHPSPCGKGQGEGTVNLNSTLTPALSQEEMISNRTISR